MGLCLMVGALSEALQQEDCEFLPDIQEQFAVLRQCVTRAQVGDYEEPTDLTEDKWFSCQMFGYSGLHHLRRLAAYVAQNQPLYEPARKLPDEDSTVARYYAAAEGRDANNLPFQHLMLHSDAEGYYVPLDFQYVIDPEEHFKTIGGGIGSSYQLLAECKALAAILELPQSMDMNSDDICEAAESPGKEVSGTLRILKWQRFGIESFTCIRLIRACERSIATGSAIVFC